VPWKLKSFNLSDDITEPRAMIVFKDNLLIPTKRGGLIKLNLKNGNQSIFHLRDSTKINYPNWHFYRDLFVDNKNRLWITSENGTAFTKDAKTFRYFNRKSKNNQGKMIGLTDRIAISNDGKIWLINDQMRVMYYENDEIIDVGKTLPGKTVLSAVCDSKNKLWILTDKNLLKYNPKNNTLYKWGKYARFDASKYSKLKLLNDTLLSATGKKGHLLINPNKLEEYNPDYNIDFVSYRINSLPTVKINKENCCSLKLPYGDNKLSISFLHNAQYPSSGLITQYSLNENNWKYTKDNTLEFYNLGSGNYDLKLRSGTKNNIKNAGIKTISFSVKTPFYKTWVFYFSFPVLMLIIGMIIFRYKALQQKRIEEQKTERFIAEEKIKSELNQKIANLEMQNLQVQMNPHFIFNSINSLKKLIMVCDTDKGIEYLQKFSTMVRLILHNSRKKLITLEEEIQLLKLYLAFESLRFTSNFEYSIELNSTLDASFINLPPMILQPFVENAIWHGLLHLKQKQPILIIKFYPNDDDLVCEIIDNGIGRKASKQFSKTKHKSLGTTITKERLQIYQNLTKKSIELKYVDLYNDKTPLGTKVIITMQDNI